ncbi:uncharacterized protein LAESUDRAFT_760351 [Laetiporus sulphureus 93-53]|uniref:DUF4100 domain-containing protein n=1 Tax=Laetiporus sulphureus 93-53 TaxID=1314785 RepID=A0A165DRL7_9APHY|nr:uncharacterized protein LAESUDRAFT_760351 [Laetiporus sulphureus 93-53]KZT05481.1 hypothetical protein LAESUDRAFT_760351 [Laetiporus sulphureus 93-53]
MTERLVLENIIKYASNGRLVHCDGTLLPRFPGKGGIAALLIAESKARLGDRYRDLPPHQMTRDVQAVGLLRDSQEVIRGNVFAVSADQVYSFSAVTQSKAKPTVETESEEEVSGLREVDIEHAKGRGSGRPSIVKVQSPSDKTAFTRVEGGDSPGHGKGSQMHSSNTEEGWKERERKKAEEWRWGDGKDKYGDRSGAQYRFTSQLQDSVSIDEVQARILDSEISLPIRAILGASPELQKRIASMTKTRREFSAKAGDSVLVSLTSPPESPDHQQVTGRASGSQLDVADADKGGDSSGVAYLTCADPTEAMQILHRFANAVSLGSKCFYAMASGIVQGKFGSEDITYLVDSGSELNLITSRVYDQAGVEIDSDGARWSLKGISGDPVPLLGCCRDAPVEIGGWRFDHHFFVGTWKFGHHDGILGQPWLQWYSAQIDYTRRVSADLLAYPSEDRTSKCLRICLIGVDNSRNSDRLIMASSGETDGVGAL